MVEGGAARIGCTVIPAGAGQTEMQVQAIVASIRDVTKLRGEVQLEVPGALPDDGKLIEDRRDYT